MLADWARDPGRSRLLVTCRYPITLPDNADQQLLHYQLGPLSPAEAEKFMWSLPALDRLDAPQQHRIWRLVGGHPRSLEYLEALLNQGIGRYPDITDRLAQALDRNQGARAALAASEPGELLDAAVAPGVANPRLALANSLRSTAHLWMSWWCSRTARSGAST